MTTCPRRLVLMRFEADESAQQVRDVHTSFAAIPGVSCAVSVAPAVVHDGASAFTHVSLFEFASAASRAEYQDHPLHISARSEVRGRAKEVLVIDVD